MTVLTDLWRLVRGFAARSRKQKREICDLRLQVRNLKEMRQILSDKNRYYAALRIGHSPNEEEAFDHYFNHGGRDHFNQTHPSG